MGRNCPCIGVEIQGYRSTGLVRIPSHMADLAEVRKASGIAMWEWLSIDGCLIAEIRDLWDAGIHTTGCCCGHNTHPPYIGVAFGDIKKMKALGYEVAPNRARPADEDSFIPKSIRRSEISLPIGEIEAFVLEIRDLIEKVTFDESGRMVAGKWVGGNGGLLQRETLAAADTLRRRLDTVASLVAAHVQQEGN